MERVNLLICDLDGTLLGDEPALDDFAAWYARAKRQFRLAYSSGRFIDSILESLDESNLPEPDAVIGGVGTEIYKFNSADDDWGWPPTTISWNPHVVRAICATHRILKLQPTHFQSFYKVSFYAAELSESFVELLRQELAAVGQRVALVYSSNRDLDVLPAGVNKGAAAEFVAHHWGVPRQRVIAAGDSGNDAAMFRAGFRGIVVGNAQCELRAFKAPNVYHAKAECAAGVLEGIEHWMRLIQADLSTGDQWSAAPNADRGRRG